MHTHRSTRLRRFFLLGLSTLLLTACTGGAQRSGDGSLVSAGPETIDVAAHDRSFEPETLRLPAGAKVRVQLTNMGRMLHDFTIKDLSVSTGLIHPRRVAAATFTVPNGPTQFVCSIHPWMTGQIVPDITGKQERRTPNL